MSADENEEAKLDENSEISEAMSKYGITRVPVDYFHYGKFRYTNLKDAIAQAKRDEQTP